MAHGQILTLHYSKFSTWVSMSTRSQRWVWLYSYATTCSLILVFIGTRRVAGHTYGTPLWWCASWPKLCIITPHTLAQQV